MERVVKLHIEKLPEGFFLATSSDIQGLIAQGRTATEAIEIARDVAKKILEAQYERNEEVMLPEVSEEFDCQLMVGT